MINEAMAIIVNFSYVDQQIIILVKDTQVNSKCSF